MQFYSKCNVLLPRADEQGFTIEDVIPEDPSLEQVLDLDSLLRSDGLKDPQVAGIIVLSLDGTVRLAASGPDRGFEVTRLRKAEVKDSLDRSKTSNPPRVKHVIPLGSVSIVEGSDCTCTHGGAVVNICKRRP
jgi:hypothetical protein